MGHGGTQSVSLKRRALNELQGRKLVFNVLFWGFHWGMFAYGWWKQVGHANIHYRDMHADTRTTGL